MTVGLTLVRAAPIWMMLLQCLMTVPTFASWFASVVWIPNVESAELEL